MDAYAYLWKVTGEEKYRRFAERIFKDMMFYTSGRLYVEETYRFPLGYVFDEDVLFLEAKVHAWTTRYGQVFLWAVGRERKR